MSQKETRKGRARVREAGIWWGTLEEPRQRVMKEYGAREGRGRERVRER